MRLPRFRLRTLMLIVAVAALALGADARRKVLRIRYQRKATEHGLAFGQLYRQMTDSALWQERERVADDWVHHRSSGSQRYSEESTIAVAQQLFDQLEKRYGRKIQHHRTLERKYIKAASRPWLPVSPDPPEPE